MNPHTSNLDHILAMWRAEAAASDFSKERIKGTAFEKLCVAFLTYDSLQKTYYELPMTYAEWAYESGTS